MTKENKHPQPRKEPGLISQTFTVLVRFIVSLIFALLLSITIEWIGIAFIWPEQGERHAQQMLRTETRYLDQRFIHQSAAVGRSVYALSQRINQWIISDSGIVQFIQALPSRASGAPKIISVDTQPFYQQYRPYIVATVVITQLFFVRLAIIVLSLSVFLLFVITGLVDGLVERHLRRLGGGRESSNVYNLARQSVVPTFMVACVIYISLPSSLHPAVVMLPFAILLGFSVKMTFDKLKKYF